MGTIANALNAAANSYKGFFGFSAKLAEGVAMGDSHLPIRHLHDPSGHIVYLRSTSDEAILLHLLKARNLKRIRLFIDYSESGPTFISGIWRLFDAKIPVTVSIAVGKFAFGKRTALYILRESAATMLEGWPPNVLDDQKLVVIGLSLPSANLVQGFGQGVGRGVTLKKIK